MNQGSTSIQRPQYGGKIPRVSLPLSPILSPLSSQISYCSYSDVDDYSQDNVYDSNGELQPHIYFKLAQVLVQPSQIKHYNYSDPFVKDLFRNAYILGRDRNRMLLIIKLVCKYSKAFNLGTVRNEVVNVLRDYDINQEHKLEFVMAIVQHLQRNRDGPLFGLIETHNGLTIDNSTRILLNEITFSKLLPLISMLYALNEANSTQPSTPEMEEATVVSHNGDNLPNYSPTSVVADGIFETINDDGSWSQDFYDLESTFDSNASYLILSVPSQAGPPSPPQTLSRQGSVHSSQQGSNQETVCNLSQNRISSQDLFFGNSSQDAPPQELTSSQAYFRNGSQQARASQDLDFSYSTPQQTNESQPVYPNDSMLFRLSSQSPHRVIQSPVHVATPWASPNTSMVVENDELTQLVLQVEANYMNHH